MSARLREPALAGANAGQGRGRLPGLRPKSRRLACVASGRFEGVKAELRGGRVQPDGKDPGAEIHRLARRRRRLGAAPESEQQAAEFRPRFGVVGVKDGGAMGQRHGVLESTVLLQALADEPEHERVLDSAPQGVDRQSRWRWLRRLS